MNPVKAALVLVSVCAVVLAEDVSQSNLETIMGYHKECKAESNLSDNVAAGIFMGNFPDDLVLKQHLFCMSKKLGTQNEAGEIQAEALRQKVSKIVHDEEKVNTLVETCSIQKETPEDTAFEMTKCVYTETHP